MPGVREFTAQFRMVVDLAVEDDHVAAAGRDHRLAALVGEVDDGQTAVTEVDARVHAAPEAGAVGAAVGERRGHPLQTDVIGGTGTPRQDASQTTHRSPPSSTSGKAGS
jgi:hypothetical protein